jgi:hypothetical protein
MNSIVLWKNADKKVNTSKFEYGYQYRQCAASYQYWQFTRLGTNTYTELMPLDPMLKLVESILT